MRNAKSAIFLAGFVAMLPPAVADEATPPAEVIASRQALMMAMETLMQPIDTYTVDRAGIDTGVMRANAEAIQAMLLVTPQLFPDSTNLYDAKADLPATLAMPEIWKNFAAFRGFATAASGAAASVVESADGGALVEASVGLRAACDACHAVNLLPYEAPSFDSDSDFDFDALFDN